jgi:hypothetical protein
LCAAIALRAGLVTAQSQRPAHPAGAAPSELNGLVETYCGDCHNDQLKRGNVSFEHFDIAKAVTTLNLPKDDPQAAGRHDAAAWPGQAGRGVIRATDFDTEAKADLAATAHPNPGTRVFPRLNRTEYKNSIQALLDLEVDPGLWLPLDQKSANFDNIADEQTISATLLESYLNAAAEISRLAVGDKNAPPLTTPIRTDCVSQHPDRLRAPIDAAAWSSATFSRRR